MIRCWEVHRPDEGVRGWLVVDSLRNGIAFGGTRFAPDLTRDEVVLLARCMTWKPAAHGLPRGGQGRPCDRSGGPGARPGSPSSQRNCASRRRPAPSWARTSAPPTRWGLIYAHLGIPSSTSCAPGAACRPTRAAGYREAMTGQGLAGRPRTAGGPTPQRPGRDPGAGSSVRAAAGWKNWHTHRRDERRAGLRPVPRRTQLEGPGLLRPVVVWAWFQTASKRRATRPSMLLRRAGPRSTLPQCRRPTRRGHPGLHCRRRG